MTTTAAAAAAITDLLAAARFAAAVNELETIQREAEAESRRRALLAARTAEFLVERWGVAAEAVREDPMLGCAWVDRLAFQYDGMREYGAATLQGECPRCGQLVWSDGLVELAELAALLDRFAPSWRHAESACPMRSHAPQPAPTLAEQLEAVVRGIVRDELYARDTDGAL